MSSLVERLTSSRSDCIRTLDDGDCVRSYSLRSRKMGDIKGCVNTAHSDKLTQPHLVQSGTIHEGHRTRKFFGIFYTLPPCPHLGTFGDDIQ